MLTVDTTVVVRLITNDSPREARRAAALFASKKIFLPETVLLETAWVLRHAYGLEPDAIATSLRRLLGLANVTVADPLQMNRALQLYEQGLDFADALQLARRARAAGVRGVSLL